MEVYLISIFFDFVFLFFYFFILFFYLSSNNRTRIFAKCYVNCSSPLSRVASLFYNRKLLEELRSFSKTRQRTLQLKEADTLLDNGPINLS